MTILLGSDRNAAPQDHLDELTARVTVLFVSTLLLTLVWSMYVDDVLQRLLTMLEPCPVECMNVYEPAQWSAVRWSTSLLLGLFSVLPLILHHIHQFAKPGLLKSEFKTLRRWTIGSAIVLLGVAYLLLSYGLPDLYAIGYDQHMDAGLQAQYNAVHLLMFAVYLVWVLWLFIGTWMLLALVGQTGLLTNFSADWWRLRIYGLGVLLLLVTVPEHAHSAALPLIALFLISCEWIARPWLRHVPSQRGVAAVRFDHEGRRRRYALVDCSCEGANLHGGYADVEGFSTVNVNALCLSTADQEQVLEHIMRAGITDAVITGCDVKPCPKRWMENVSALGAQVHGLNMMRLQNHRIGGHELNLDVRLSLIALTHQGQDESIEYRITDVLDEFGRLPSELVNLSHRDIGWSDYYGPATLFRPIMPNDTG